MNCLKQSKSADSRNRRQMLAMGVAGVAAWNPTTNLLVADKKKSVFQATELNHISLDILHPGRSKEFYRGLFGMTPVPHGRGSDNFLHFYVEMFGTKVTNQSKDRCVLAIPGDSFIELSTGSKPGMKHYCYAIKDFEQREVVEKLNAFSGAEVERKLDHAIETKDPQGITVQLYSIGHKLA